MATGTKKGKTAQKGQKAASKPLYGEKIKLVNMSGEDKYCASTGLRLPLNGMVVKYENNYYIDWNASERAYNQKSR